MFKKIKKDINGHHVFNPLIPFRWLRTKSTNSQEAGPRRINLTWRVSWWTRRTFESGGLWFTTAVVFFLWIPMIFGGSLGLIFRNYLVENLDRFPQKFPWKNWEPVGAMHWVSQPHDRWWVLPHASTVFPASNSVNITKIIPMSKLDSQICPWYFHDMTIMIYVLQNAMICHMGGSINGGTPIAGWFISGKIHL